MADEIRSRNEKPMTIASREFLQQLYGSDSVWGRLYRLQDVQDIKREDLLRFYEKNIVPNRIRIAVSGDITFDALISKIDALTQDWPQGTSPRQQLASVEKKWEPSLQLIPKDVNQSAIVVGHFAEKRTNPDKYALILANQILGGLTFGSKLGDRIRGDLGLAYSINSFYGLETDYGAFRVMVSTKTESTIQVIEEMLKVMRETINNEKMTQADLDAAKNTILNQLIFQYEDTFDIVSARMVYDYYGYPPNYMSIYQKGIRSVTLAGLKKVAHDYFFPDKMKILVVGSEKIKPQLEALGKLEILPLDED